MSWVDESDCMIGLVNGPSHGVGMEIQHGIDKPKIGLNPTPILCLVSKDRLSKLSYMIRGVTTSESSVFNLKPYQSFEDIKIIISEFAKTH